MAETTSSRPAQQIQTSGFIAKCSRAGREFLSRRYWLRDTLLGVLLGLVAFFFLFQPVQVEGTSMVPGLENHERIFVNRLAYRMEPIRRFDIIVFRYPGDPQEYFIKRVIGLPGERVSLNDGIVYINGKPLPESFIPRAELGDETAPEVYVPPRHYYVLGDHREFSSDSRDWGTLDRRWIYGKAVFAYWPLGQIGPLGREQR